MTRNIAITCILLAFTLPAAAVNHQPEVKAAASASVLTDGEVRKVDKEAKKITIRHGPITNLDMPAMSMVFQVKDAAMLDQVKAGDKIRFAADKQGGAYIVTQIEALK
jgi:Cu(I)/Ag(I) efflux system periplasmic protein CusF